MPKTKTNNGISSREETFCQWVATGIVSNTQAYINAGYSEIGADGNARRMIVRDIIKARIAELTAKKAEKWEVTQDSIAKEAEEHRLLALAGGDIRAATGALVVKAKAYGFQTDKTVTERSEQAKELSERERQLAQEFAEWREKKEAGKVIKMNTA